MKRAPIWYIVAPLVLIATLVSLRRLAQSPRATHTPAHPTSTHTTSRVRPSPAIISVVGVAENLKAGAIVVTENGAFYVDRLRKWPPNWLKKQVLVSGEIEIVDEPTIGTDGLVRAGRGQYTTLRNATWCLVE